MNDDWTADYTPLSAPHPDEDRDDISDEDFCRSVAFFFEGVPDENQR